jgi:hypothetical protein
MVSSGTNAYNPSISDLLIESFERIGVRSAELTAEHMYSARMSCNLILSSWMNRGVNLWKVDQQIVPLVQGVATYNVPSTTVMILDTYIRTYQMNGVVNVTLPAFATTSNSSTVTITQANNGVQVGNYVNIYIPVSVGGVVLYGFYQVTSTPTANTYTINAASSATSTVTSGGVVPYLTTTSGSTSLNVYLPNHGYVAGQPFVVQVSTFLGGETIFGTYTIETIVDVNNFTITLNYNASSTASVYENNGMAQIALQQVSAAPVDRLIYPISRSDYAATANKTTQGFSSTYWFDRLLAPTITLWQVPDGNGPYELIYYRSAQIFDASPTSNQTLDAPLRFMEAFCSEFAYHLARKWKPALETIRKQDAVFAWTEAAQEDAERVPFYVNPITDSYYD